MSVKAARKDKTASIAQGQPDQAPTGGEGETGKDIRVGGGVLAWSHPGRKGESELPLPKSAC